MTIRVLALTGKRKVRQLNLLKKMNKLYAEKPQGWQEKARVIQEDMNKLFFPER